MRSSGLSALTIVLMIASQSAAARTGPQTYFEETPRLGAFVGAQIKIGGQTSSKEDPIDLNLMARPNLRRGPGPSSHSRGLQIDLLGGNDAPLPVRASAKPRKGTSWLKGDKNTLLYIIGGAAVLAAGVLLLSDDDERDSTCFPPELPCD